MSGEARKEGVEGMDISDVADLLTGQWEAKQRPAWRKPGEPAIVPMMYAIY